MCFLFANRRSLLTIGLLCLLAGCESGCSNDDPENSEQVSFPFSERTVSIESSASGSLQKRWPLVLEDWSQSGGGQWEISELTTQAEAKSAVVVMTMDELSSELQHHEFDPVPARFRSIDGVLWSGLYESLRESVGRLNGEPTLIPLRAQPYVLYIRKDLLSAAGKTPPNTWEEYRELAASVDEWATGKFVAEPWNEDSRAATFLAHTTPFARHPENYALFFDTETGESLINREGFKAGTEELLKLLPHLDSSNWSRSPMECRTEFLAGRAAMAIGLEPPPREKTAASRSDTVDVSIIPLPGANQVYDVVSQEWDTPQGSVNRTTIAAGPMWFAGVRRGSEESRADLDAEWSVLETLVIGDGAGTWPTPLRSPVRTSHSSDVGSWIGDGLTRQEKGRYMLALARSLMTSPVIPVIRVQAAEQFTTKLTEGVSRLESESPTASELLDQIHSEWTAIIQKEGSDAIVDSYRRGLGLRPKLRIDDSTNER